MKKYYGLRLMSFFYMTLSVVIALISIAGIGFILMDHFVLGNGDVNAWASRALTFLLIGGISALTCYVVGQLLDSQIETLKAVYKLHDMIPQMEALRQSNAQLVEQLQSQKAMLNSLGAIAPADHSAIQTQIAERRRRIADE
jgi:hypothetical protein